MSKKVNQEVKEKEVTLLTGALNIIGLGINQETTELIVTLHELVQKKGRTISLGELEALKETYQEKINKKTAAQQPGPANE